MDANIDLTVEDILNFSKEKKFEYIDSIRIEYKRLLDMKTSILEIFENNKYSKEPDGFILEGCTGSGKSTLLDLIEEEFSERQEECITKKELVRVTVPPNPTVISFLKSTLRGMRDPRYDKGTKYTLLDQIISKSDMCGIHYVLFDEFHELVNSSSQKVITEVSDIFKYIIKKCNWSTVLCGTSGGPENVVASNTQLFRLFEDSLELKPFTYIIDDVETIKEWNTLLFEIETKLPLKNRSYLDDSDISYRIFYASQGLISWTMKLLRNASKKSISAGREYITKDDLAHSFTSYLAPKRRKIRNPFEFDPPYPPPPLPRFLFQYQSS